MDETSVQKVVRDSEGNIIRIMTVTSSMVEEKFCNG